ncbi:hypothetical protein GMA12_17490 [Kocuria sediminis]|uniref:N-acetylglutamate synthase n=1 Tax=Kocuria sediminis TaxID=1038857 RepID=A0A6N8GPA7_9MICC|nr:hypothetical protein [Kocuria sediminis]MUN64911.1 hypothetical protein [Kocuria sediminis]
MDDNATPTSKTVRIDGRRFTGASNTAEGEVGSTTIFTYHQEGGTVWADYAGGAVRKGFLVGTRTDDTLTFRYTHLNVTGETASGRCISKIEVLADGRVRFHESWAWESRTGTGTSVVEETG